MFNKRGNHYNAADFDLPNCSLNIPCRLHMARLCLPTPAPFVIPTAKQHAWSIQE